MRVWLLAVVAAWSARVPGDYPAEVAARTLVVVERLNQEGRYGDVVEAVDLVQRSFPLDSHLAYEKAFALRALGKLEEAEKEYRRAVSLQDSNAAAWYDLGELLLQRGALEQAEEAFTHAARLRPDHWAGYFRLADTAARRGDGEAFEAHLREALRRGFRLADVAHDPSWRRYFRTEPLRGVLLRLITVYGDETLLREFESDDEAQVPG